MTNPLCCIISFLIVLIVFLTSSISAQTRGNIPVNKFLTASNDGSQWLSPSGDFAFGFHQFLNDSTNLYLLSIWYAKIPDTIIWYANDGNPVPQGSTVTITSTEGLLLSDPKGAHIWNASAGLGGARDVGFGVMNDTGNFILTSKSNSNPVWQSFDHPTDTLLPTQIMNLDGTVDCRLSDTNFTKGSFQMHLQVDGNVVFNIMVPILYTAYADPYFVTQTYQPPTQGRQVIYDKLGSMYVVAANGSVLYDFIPKDKIVSVKDYYQRATMTSDGILTWYYHPRKFSKNDGVGWSKIYSEAGNICCVRCGYNNICSYDVVAQSLRCDCPPSYSLIDPDDKYGSCKPDFDLWEKDKQGPSGNVEYKLVPLENTEFSLEKCDGKFKHVNEENCKSSCLDEHYCAAVNWVSDNGGTCCKMNPLFLGGNRAAGSEGKTVWFKVGNGSSSTVQFVPSADHILKKKARMNIVVSILLGGSVFVNFILLLLGIFFIYNKKQLKIVSIANDEYSSNVSCFSYKVLEDATNGFKEELGRGAFGVVYKGIIRASDSSILVAVKKLDRISNNADKEFETEVNVIGKTHHKNLVQLVGFCKENDQRLLVYEYMSNGSLADFLFGDQRPSWVARIKIAQGIAGGLTYLHQQCITQIIHCDIKPQNVLIDEYHNARISDFGMAKLMALNQTHTNTAIRGTKGYVAPEWFRNKPVTTKVDVYSFGVLLLEIICCRKNVSIELFEVEGAILTDWAFDCYQSNTIENLVGDDLEALNNRLQLTRFVMISLWCIQEDPNLRPSMTMVTQMLEGHAEVPPPPCPASFSTSYP
ncbi:unnamed protein product [Amaranthus hypochondriacus]